MVETPSPEEIRKKPLAALIDDVFERRVSTSAVKKERQLIMETYGAKFQAIVDTLPAEKRQTTSIVVQKLLVTVGSIFSEYGARISDFTRNLILWPIVRSSPDFPKDRFYQTELARAKAWGTFGRDTTKTATAERLGYRNHFLPTTIGGAEAGAVAVGSLALPFAVGIGLVEGAAKGLAFGLGGAAVGAAIGAGIGGAYSIVLKLQDRIFGPPVVYYDMNDLTPSTVGSNSFLKMGSSFNITSPAPLGSAA